MEGNWYALTSCSLAINDGIACNATSDLIASYFHLPYHVFTSIHFAMFNMYASVSILAAATRGAPGRAPRSRDMRVIPGCITLITRHSRYPKKAWAQESHQEAKIITILRLWYQLQLVKVPLLLAHLDATQPLCINFLVNNNEESHGAASISFGASLEPLQIRII